MCDLVLAQYFPLVHRLGRFAFANSDNKNFIEEFKEQIRVSDPDCRSILMILNNDGIQSPNHIQYRCQLVFYNSYD